MPIGRSYPPDVSTRASSGNFQFPHAEEAKRLGKGIQNRLAHYAGTGFYCALLKMRPHGEPGGNKPLHFIHELDVLDKHKLLIPTVDYAKMDFTAVTQQFPDFRGMSGDMGISGFGGLNMRWRISVPREQWGNSVPPMLNVFKRELNIATDIVLNVGSSSNFLPLLPTLEALVDATSETVAFMRAGATSY